MYPGERGARGGEGKLKKTERKREREKERERERKKEKEKEKVKERERVFLFPHHLQSDAVVAFTVAVLECCFWLTLSLNDVVSTDAAPTYSLQGKKRN